MRKYIKLCVTALLVSIITLLVSCPATPPSIPDSGIKPFQKPAYPENITVTSGLKDRIIISWDPVETADYYTVYLAPSSDPSDLHRLGGTSGNTLDLKKSETPSLKTSSAYVFSIVARQYYGAGEYLESDFSPFVEGAIAPTANDIPFHIYIVGNDMNLYWNCRNLFRQFDVIADNPTLYKAEFRLYKSLDNWQSEEEIKCDGEYSFDNPWLDCVLNVNDYKQDDIVSFRVDMTIEYDNGSIPYTVTGPVLSLQIISDMNTSPIKSADIKVTQGDRIEGINVEWTVPSWSGKYSWENSVFKIERAEENSEIWETLIDELTEGPDRDKIIHIESENEGATVFSYVDTEAKVDKRYVYRITNAISLNNILYTHSEAELEESPVAYLYDAATSNMICTPEYDENKTSAKVTLSWTIDTQMPEGLEWKISRTINHADASIGSKPEYVNNPDIKIVDDKATAIFEESIDCAECDDRKHTITYSLEAIIKDGQRFYKDAGAFEGNVELVYSGLFASENLVNSIDISWIEIADGDTYSYKLNQGEAIELSQDEISKDENGLCKATIWTGDTAVNSITLLSSSSSGSPNTDRTASCAIKNFQDLDFSVNETRFAKKAILQWNAESYDARAEYSYQWKQADGDWSNEEPIPHGEFQNGKIDFRANSTCDVEKPINFRIVIKNAVYPEKASLYTADHEYSFLSSPVDVSASNGTSADSISIKWSACDSAARYAIYRYEASKGESSAKMIGETDSTVYKDSDSSLQAGIDYVYQVASIDNDGEKAGKSKNSENEFNKLYSSENKNIGYIYNPAALTNLSVMESISADGYINDYVVVSFIADKTNKEYTVSASNDPSFTFSLDELTAESNGLRTNGKSADTAGYVELNPETGTIKANAQIGTVDYQSLQISDISISAKTEGIGNTAITSLQGSWYRGLMDIEYLNLFNGIFSTLITEINGKFKGDWWGGGSWFTGAITCDGENYTAENCSGTKVSGLISIPSEYGKITIDDYSSDLTSITTNNNSISVMSTGDSGGALGTDPLDKIGPDANNRTATMQVKSKYSEDKEIKYVTADISINNISPDSSSSSESCYVIISGKDYGSAGHEEIFMNDPRLVEKIRIIK